MHHFLTAFYAFVFSFGHAAPAPQTAAVEPAPVVTIAAYSPTREELARGQSRAIQACVSCRRINASYVVR